MMRFAFFLLLIANLVFGAHLYLSATRPAGELPPEVNADAMKIASVTDAIKAQQDAETTRKLVSSLAGAACVDFSVKPADATRARALFDSMSLADRLGVRNVEEFTRFGVSLPAQKDKRSADQLVASLKKAGVKDVSTMGDNSVSLGIFSSEEAAKRYLTELESKASALVKGTVITPRNSQWKETIFTVRDPDRNLVARLGSLQRDFEGSALKPGTCPGSPATSGAAPATPNGATTPPTNAGSAPATAPAATNTTAAAAPASAPAATPAPAVVTAPAPSKAPPATVKAAPVAAPTAAKK